MLFARIGGQRVAGVATVKVLVKGTFQGLGIVLATLLLRSFFR